MAITYAQETPQELDNRVIELYKKLMDASTGQDSVYLKSKETLQQIVDNTSLTAREKAEFLSQSITNMVNGITAQSMQAAIDLAKDDRDSDYLLTKLREDTKLVTAQIAKLEADALDTEAAKNLKIAQAWKVQGELYRDYGMKPWLLTYTNVIPSQDKYDDTYGTKVEEIQLGQANKYLTYANAYRQHGYVAIDRDAVGFLTASTTGNADGLSFWQAKVAERQELGFDDNMRQHVANSSATMISMLLSTEAAGIDYTPYLNSWNNAITYLNTTQGATAGTIANDTPPASISIAVGATLTGTTVNINAGSAVSVVITDGTTLSATIIGIVQLDGTWSAVVTPESLVGLVPAAGNISASVLDSTGQVRTDIDAVTLVA